MWEIFYLIFYLIQTQSRYNYNTQISFFLRLSLFIFLFLRLSLSLSFTLSLYLFLPLSICMSASVSLSFSLSCFSFSSVISIPPYTLVSLTVSSNFLIECHMSHYFFGSKSQLAGLKLIQVNSKHVHHKVNYLQLD